MFFDFWLICLFSYNLQIYPFSVTIYLYLIYIKVAYSAILKLFIFF